MANENPTKTVTFAGKTITLTRWGINGMWGIPQDAPFGLAYWGRSERYEQRAEPYWVYICDGKHPRACYFGHYERFASLKDLAKTYPHAIEFDGAGEVWSLAHALRKLHPGESIIAGIPGESYE